MKRKRELYELLNRFEKVEAMAIAKKYWRFVKEAFEIFTYDEAVEMLKLNKEMSFVVYEQHFHSHFGTIDPYKVMNGNNNMRLHNAVGINRTFTAELEHRLNQHFTFPIRVFPQATSTSFTITIRPTSSNLPPKKKHKHILFTL
jgi:hypothetical protein